MFGATCIHHEIDFNHMSQVSSPVKEWEEWGRTSIDDDEFILMALRTPSPVKRQKLADGGFRVKVEPTEENSD